jgi:transglutaminase-like putative cysteine protease
MSIHVALHHRTSYRYDRPIELGPQVIRLRPAPHSRSRILSYSLKITPEKHFLNWQQDPQSNFLARLVIPEKTKEFSVEVDVVVEMAVFNPFDFFLEPEGENFPFEYDSALDHELAPFLKRGELTPKFADYFTQLESELLAMKPWPPRTTDALVAINQRLWKDIGYTVRLEPGVQTPEETLTKRTGSCRDTSWLMVQLMRRLGIAARFVSGYLIQLKPDVKSLDGPSGTEVDFTDLHAWCEV